MQKYVKYPFNPIEVILNCSQSSKIFVVLRMKRNFKVGFVGLGMMGSPMCSHILNAGYEVSVFNRTKSKSEDLIKKGAKWQNSPKEVAQNSDVIFTIVGFPKDVEEVYFGELGILKGAKKGTIIVDMTTSNPSIAEKIYYEAKRIGVSALDAPVSGGDIGAKNAKLVIMVGGDQSVFDEVLPLFKLLGEAENIKLMGKAGSGQHCKMANQIHIATTMIGVVECLLYAYKSGLNLDQMIDLIGKGAAASWSLNNLGKRIVKGDFNPGFLIKHFVKDMGIALEEAKRMNLSLPGLSLAYQFYVAAIAQGYENLGTQGLYKVIAGLNGIKT
jgi:3-hydroxyisobutyrate dehydrogenase